MIQIKLVTDEDFEAEKKIGQGTKTERDGREKTKKTRKKAINCSKKLGT